MTNRRGGPRRTARHGLPIQGALPPRRPVEPVSQRRGPFLLLAMVVLTLTAGLAGRRILTSGFFRIGDIQVAGVQMLSPEQVAEASGLRGKQFWQLKPAEARAAVESLPAVRAATLTTHWPNRVSITVEERIPAAIWRVNGASAVVDEDGVVLEAAVIGGMPAINETDERPPLATGDRVDGDAVRLAIRLGETLPASVGQRVGRFEYTNGGGLDVVTDRNLRVRLGDSQNLAYKFELWRGIANRAKDDKFTPAEIDLRFGEWAAYR